MTHIDLNLYKNIIFDFDGVILDSNTIKKEAIWESTKDLLDKKTHNEFVEYFIHNNGVPRETKIKKFFIDENLYKKVLQKYNTLLEDRLLNANLTNGLNSFLQKLSFYNLSLFVLSGGDEEEVKTLLKNKNLINKFKAVKGGPKIKEKNLEELNLDGKTLYIGDSKIDYEVSYKYTIDFVFMYKYTQFFEWKNFFKDKDILIIKDFSTLTQCYC